MKGKNLIFKVAGIIIVIFLFGNVISLAFGGTNIYTMIYEHFNVPKEEKVNYTMIYEHFNVPEDEKVNYIYIEGMKENVDYIGVKSSIGYEIQYDEEVLNLSRENKKDFYRASIDEIKDKVYFSIEFLETSYEDFKLENKNNDIEEFYINGQRAFNVNFIDGDFFDETKDTTWDSDVKTLWYIDAKEGTYLIEEHYFMEAAEGWGARLGQMINTFKIVEEI